MGEYSDFQKISETIWIYVHPRSRVADYEKFTFDPVSVYPNPALKIKKADKKLLKELADVFRNGTIQAFDDGHTIVKESGGGVLRVQMALLDIKPFNWVTQEDGTHVFKTDTTLEGTKFEVDCIDSISGERIAALVTFYGGEEYSAHKDPNRLKNVEVAFDEWIHLLRHLLDTAKSIEPGVRQFPLPKLKKAIQ